MSSPEGLDRRGLLVGAAALGVAGVTPAASPPPPVAAVAAAVPPHAELVYEALALLEPTIEHGQGRYGHRARVPIIGGWARGPGFSARILPGGADWQLLRADGYKELEADYYMETEDKALIHVINRGLVSPMKPGAARYAMSTPWFEAPSGRYEWMNQHIFVGTVGPGEPDRPSVRLMIYKLL
ncbi:MAG: hypothetical protein RLZZ200_2749 [Pseudomonadota bacterium]|jgi:hypothetical protein